MLVNSFLNLLKGGCIIELNTMPYNSKVFTAFTIVKITILPTSEQSGRGNGVVSLSRRGSVVLL